MCSLESSSVAAAGTGFIWLHRAKTLLSPTICGSVSLSVLSIELVAERS